MKDTSTIIYRQARPEDKAQLRHLGIMAYGQYEAVLTPEYFAQLQGFLHDEEKLRELMQRSTCFVCEDQGNLVGMAYLVPQGNAWDIFEDSWSYIRMVGVHPEYAGHGIATALTAQCIDHARNTGEQVIALHTSEFMDAARYIYERAGFKRVKAIPDRLGKKYWLYLLQLQEKPF